MLKTTHKRLFLLGVVGIGNRVYRQNWASSSLTFTMSHRSCRTIVLTPSLYSRRIPSCCCPFCLSTPGKLVDLETFFLFSPNLVGDTALTVTAHTSFYIGIYHPFFLHIRTSNIEYFLYCIMGASSKVSDSLTGATALQNRA